MAARKNPPASKMRDPLLCAAMAKRAMKSYDGGERIIDQIAHMMSGGDDWDNALSPSEAARYLGCHPGYGNAALQRIRAGLGKRQAA